MDASSDVTVELRGGALRLEDAKRAVELELEQVQRQRKAELAELQGAQQHASRTEGDLHLIRDLQSKLESANHGRREAEEERDDLAQYGAAFTEAGSVPVLVVCSKAGAWYYGGRCTEAGYGATRS